MEARGQLHTLIALPHRKSLLVLTGQGAEWASVSPDVTDKRKILPCCGWAIQPTPCCYTNRLWPSVYDSIKLHLWAKNGKWSYHCQLTDLEIHCMVHFRARPKLQHGFVLAWGQQLESHRPLGPLELCSPEMLLPIKPTVSKTNMNLTRTTCSHISGRF
jgi:hypothetical protein